jgi:hypothetical protein
MFLNKLKKSMKFLTYLYDVHYIMLHVPVRNEMPHYL